MRKDKIEYYLNIASNVSERSTCLRRRYGCIIVNNDEIISSGYNGAPRDVINCCDKKFCLRQKLNIPAGERYEACMSIHGETNAIISAARKDMIGATLYLVGIDVKTNSISEYQQPCAMCRRVIINAGIERIITPDNKTLTQHIILHRSALILQCNSDLIDSIDKNK